MIALEKGPFPRVMYVLEEPPSFHVNAEELTPMPLAYLGGEMP